MGMTDDTGAWICECKPLQLPVVLAWNNVFVQFQLPEYVQLGRNIDIIPAGAAFIIFFKKTFSVDMPACVMRSPMAGDLIRRCPGFELVILSSRRESEAGISEWCEVTLQMSLLQQVGDVYRTHWMASFPCSFHAHEWGCVGTRAVHYSIYSWAKCGMDGAVILRSTHSIASPVCTLPEPWQDWIDHVWNLIQLEKRSFYISWLSCTTVLGNPQSFKATFFILKIILE